ncbi:unnamed protein product [Lota lota]
MAQQHHHHQRLFYCALLLLCAVRTLSARASQISDLKSKITGVEELLEEFRKQLQQDQAYTTSRQGGGVVVDSCLGEFTSAEEHIIRARASIEHGATFLSVPGPVYNWKDCLHACCSEPHCTLAVVQEDLGESEESLRCYLFNCTYRNRNVCSFTPQQGFSTHSRGANTTAGRPSSAPIFSEVVDEPPRSDAGQDVVIQLPTDWAVLDGRDSLDDYGISRYEWTLVQGEPSVSMKVTHPGLLKISGLQQGDYTFQMTVTDTGGQRSSDNVSVSVLAPERHAEVCTGHCSHYQFLCDDGCCIDIDYACDGKQHCPDRSDEDFCPKFESSRKTVTHPVSGGVISHNMPAASQIEGAGRDPSTLRTGSEVGKTIESIVPHPEVPSKPQDRTKLALPPPPPPPAHQGSSGQDVPASQGTANMLLKTVRTLATYCFLATGAILPLALGIIITSLLLLMIGCRLRLVRHKLKKTRPLTTEESDYLINGMYL